MSNDQLRACPACGEDLGILVMQDEDGDPETQSVTFGGFFVMCACGCRSETETTLDAAMRAWNEQP